MENLVLLESEYEVLIAISTTLVKTGTLIVMLYKVLRPNTLGRKLKIPICGMWNVEVKEVAGFASNATITGFEIQSSYICFSSSLMGN